MAFPVTENGSVGCDHQGAVSLPAVSDGRLTVGGGKAVLFAGLLQQPYVNCVAPSPPGVCVSTLPAPPDAGRSARLTVGGAPVLLDSLTADSLPSATPVTVAAGQSVLTAS
ncbi:MULTISPECIES: hypothetical protein [unclassified Amycolatopsis]|uniref:hypothetical protein n=1 Tax=unclassified Amycolatopsis TaxID=2618356 RepID=UPI001FF54F69|nr:hypothetical protein [Amycolatopsis sp. FBCC-B4732]UOX91109.1 hypothetical protein MUY14_10980 [Amycolatopsis sp. FBCC-B4732]